MCNRCHVRSKTTVIAQGNGIAGHGGTDEHDTKFGCELGAGGCRLTCEGATRPAGSSVGRWADEESSGSGGSDRAVGGSSRSSWRQRVAAGGKAPRPGDIQSTPSIPWRSCFPQVRGAFLITRTPPINSPPKAIL